MVLADDFTCVYMCLFLMQNNILVVDSLVRALVFSALRGISSYILLSIPVHPRKWSRIFVPVSSLFHQLGNQIGFRSTTTYEPLASEYQSDSSFQTRRAPHESYELHSNGIIKQDGTNSIYHQLDLQSRNDENNNDTNSNPLILQLSPPSSNDFLIHSDNRLLFLKDNLILLVFYTF
ncbi:unnamed protein product [Adineta ricciae]|uniref:Uncharacterized protein n=1 Tax=Adineta ricciae TaxID=249248 RepID=A0A814FS97_ADIRI|nr:unnamed protein product [Adineta ricciae]